MQQSITARGIIVHQGKILLHERWRDGLHYFSIPGGHVEAGETIEAAVLRELHEEIGLEVRLQRQVYLVKIDDYVHHIFLCDYVDGEPELQTTAPESADHLAGTNRYKPQWIPVEKVKELPFVYWEPIREQLVHDLENGFDEDCKTIVVSTQT